LGIGVSDANTHSPSDSGGDHVTTSSDNGRDASHSRDANHDGDRQKRASPQVHRPVGLVPRHSRSKIAAWISSLCLQKHGPETGAETTRTIVGWGAGSDPVGKLLGCIGFCVDARSTRKVGNPLPPLRQTLHSVKSWEAAPPARRGDEQGPRTCYAHVMPNELVHNRLEAIRQILNASHAGGGGLSSAMIGNEREGFINLVLCNVIAPPFRIGTGENHRFSSGCRSALQHRQYMAGTSSLIAGFARRGRTRSFSPSP
jgi:hypothetical protein